MHDVHTFILRVVPPPAGVRTTWMFGFQRRLVRRCEWDTLWPKPGFFLQMSHTAATGISWMIVSRRWKVGATGRVHGSARRCTPTRHHRGQPEKRTRSGAEPPNHLAR